jgi:sugar phosphate isomerase/epimerase
MITDEISADPESAIELGAEWGVHDFELRGYFLERVPLITPYQQQRLTEILERFPARIVAISPGIFKIPFPTATRDAFPVAAIDRVMYDHWFQLKKILDDHLNELLPRSLDFANALNVPMVIIFGFERAGEIAEFPPEEVINVLMKTAEKAKSAGVQLALENEAGYWADSGARTAAILQAVNHPNLGANWDPGNAFFAGESPYPEGYEQIAKWVRHVHFKDAFRNSLGLASFAGEGQIDWSGQIQALNRDGYDGYFSIETHLSPKIAAAKFSLDRLKKLIASAKNSSNNSMLTGGLDESNP